MSDGVSPVRPPNVPATARYDAEAEENFRWQDGALDDDGKKHGPYKSWADAGYLHNECTYVHGEIDGANTVFHPDGSVASVGYREGGKLLDVVLHRPAPGVQSPEPFPGDVAASVVNARYCSRDGISNYITRYFDASGVEVCDTGVPMPPRPDGVSEDASFFPRHGRWIQGSMKRGANARVGTWKYWNDAGKLLSHEELDAEGKRVSYATYHEDTGALSRIEIHENGVRRSEKRFFSDGRLHASKEQDEQGRMIQEIRVERGIRIERNASWDERGLSYFIETKDGDRAFEITRKQDQLVCCGYKLVQRIFEASLEGDRLVRVRTFVGFGEVRTDARVDDPPSLRKLLARPEGDALESAIARALIKHVASTVESPVLAGVDQVPWSQTEGAFGTVDDFALLLKALASEETFVHGTALGNIEAAIEHQGSVYAATAAAMPFLIQLLTVETAPHGDLLATIDQCARAAAVYYDRAHEAERAPGDDTWYRDVLGTLRALGRGASTLKATFERATLEEKRLVLDILGHARGEDRFECSAHDELESFARSHADPSIRATAVHALFTVKKAPTLTWTTSDSDALVRTVAAIQLGLRLGPESPPETIEILRNALDARAELAPRMAQLPFVKCGYVATVMRGLWAIRVPAVFAMAPRLCAEVEQMDPFSAVVFGQDLLGLAFGTCELPFMPGFVDVLAALASSTKFFTFNVNASEALGMFGLPRSQDELAALVTRLQGEPDPAATLHALLNG